MTNKFILFPALLISTALPVPAVAAPAMDKGAFSEGRRNDQVSQHDVAVQLHRAARPAVLGPPTRPGANSPLTTACRLTAGGRPCPSALRGGRRGRAGRPGRPFPCAR